VSWARTRRHQAQQIRSVSHFSPWTLFYTPSGQRTMHWLWKKNDAENYFGKNLFFCIHSKKLFLNQENSTQVQSHFTFIANPNVGQHYFHPFEWLNYHTVPILKAKGKPIWLRIQHM
jgi:hypothetical protein